MKKSTAAPLRFVLLEDDPNDAELIQLQLAKDGIAVEWGRLRDYWGGRRSSMLPWGWPRPAT